MLWNHSFDMIGSPRETTTQLSKRAQALSGTSNLDTSDDEEKGWRRGAVFDSLKYVADESDSDDELEEGGDDAVFAGADEAAFCAHLEELTINAGDDPLDPTWLPLKQAKRAAQRNEKLVSCPKEYKKGPDVGSKSERMRQRYKKLLANQTSLANFGFAFSSQQSRVPQPGPQASNTLPTVESAAPTLVIDKVTEPLILSPPPSPAEEPGEFPSVTAPCSTDTQGSLGHDLDDGLISNGDGLVEDAEDAWEEVLEEQERGGVEIRGWDKLWEQVKDDLTKGLGRIEASLEIARQWHEGEGKHLARKVRALARHYQVFEQLPAEKRGGRANALSPLKDERLQLAAHQWLMLQEVGQVTPQRFQHALNETILPALSIVLARPLCERTAQHWLLKLGWQQMRLRKGVYMDGHERDDVKKYRQEVFLPTMAAFHQQTDPCSVQPVQQITADYSKLAPGERKVIAIFHDECCFHGNDYRTHAYLLPGQQILQQKGRGRIIHVSGFINVEDGRFVLRDESGNIVAEAREIIYPGANGDAWWNTEQLLKQVKRAIEIFEAAHPDCIALFIFDQSSAHASLPPDALKAFEMNKSNGGKQRKQRDTVIPNTNPTVEHCGKPQKMCLPNGQPKGLQQVLEERGFNVQKLQVKCSPICPWENEDCCMAHLLSKQDDFTNQPSMLETLIKDAGHECIFLLKFHCELNPIEMYWGWCKYHYREVTKSTFEEAK
ncbi:hypothetical protein SCLCIDRAFT_31308 [Scleroderma citrinum Foug A]|uniref:DDE-1 domain-containing protein n=1 Tax=Scleroderma citrinum Foug A TaxID=1036808 RepID=A0A0C3D072_9AGAM|nr:hypothetical protein SCLCIDRAFT_31308 [Scleroderma citrinum Foug A]